MAQKGQVVSAGEVSHPWVFNAGQEWRNRGQWWQKPKAAMVRGLCGSEAAGGEAAPEPCEGGGRAGGPHTEGEEKRRTQVLAGGPREGVVENKEAV